jgi:hypothetical protein
MKSLAGTRLVLAQAPALNGVEQALPQRDGGTPSEVYSEGLLYGKEQTALTTDDYRVVYRAYESTEGERFEVYDRRKDRRERHNLASSGAASELRLRLRRLTQAATAAARTGGGESDRELRLSEGAERKMRSLGYLAK